MNIKELLDITIEHASKSGSMEINRFRITPIVINHNLGSGLPFRYPNERNFFIGNLNIVGNSTALNKGTMLFCTDDFTYLKGESINEMPIFRDENTVNTININLNDCIFTRIFTEHTTIECPNLYVNFTGFKVSYL